jgi:NAD(P)H-quinone oxidoreductase subunit 5
MNLNLLTFIGLASPFVFIVTSVISLSGSSLQLIKRTSNFGSLLGIGVAITGGILLFNQNVFESPLLGFYEVGISFRFDTLSIIMLTMISILSFIIIRFSHNYLEGDERHGVFIGRLSATIASVQLLVISGNLGILFVSWVLTSISLQRLLLFYKDRPRARIAARKKFIAARLGDLSLFGAFYLLYTAFETGNLETIFQIIQTNGYFDGIEAIALLIGAAAVLKSAQFPLHGWLVEVMETPTPVSALLHAGLLNAGPFLIIRMAYIMEAANYASMLLIILGSVTAIFASIVYLTQTSIKTALGYSSIAHMGFSLFVCGLGLYSAALLHLVAHSFYKAHAFLSSGSAIETIRSSKLSVAERLGSPIRIIIGIVLGLGLYFFFAQIWGVSITENTYLFIIGGIIAMGLSRILTSALDSKGGINSVIQLSLLAILVTSSFFALEASFHFLLSSQIPNQTKPSFSELALVSSIALIFAVIVLIQILSPFIGQSSFSQKMAIHFKNGLYMNVLFDRVVKSIYEKEANEQSIIETKEQLNTIEPIAKQKLEKQFS